MRLEGIGTLAIRTADVDPETRACNVTRDVDQFSQIIREAMHSRTKIPSVDLIVTHFLDSGEPEKTVFPLLRNAVVTSSSFESSAGPDHPGTHHFTLAAMENAQQR